MALCTGCASKKRRYRSKGKRRTASCAHVYRIKGKRYCVRKTSRGFRQRGIASWYGPGFHGRKMANGERYNMHRMVAAHKTLPLGTKVRVRNLKTGKSIVVVIKDRGPFHRGRIIDLSKKAAKLLGVTRTGTAPVEVRAIS